MSLFSRYVKWLHTRWPAGTVERLPAVNADGTTAVPGRLGCVDDKVGEYLLELGRATPNRDLLGDLLAGVYLFFAKLGADKSQRIVQHLGQRDTCHL